MKKLISVLVFGAMITSSAAPVFAVEVNDIDGSKYENNIRNLIDSGVVDGYSDGTYKPDNPVNRAELLKMIFESLDEDLSDYPGDCFPDVTDQWYAPYICKAKDVEIIDGYSDGYFRPGNHANMAETFKIIINAYDLPVAGLGSDDPWYLPYTEFVHENNLFSKYSYLPSKQSNRGEVAYLVDNIFGIQRDESYVDASRNANSVGCGKPAPASAPSSFNVDGVQRSAIVAVPGSYSNSKAHSLIFAFHGRTNSNTRVRSYYGIEKAAGSDAIVVYPAGLQSGSGYKWTMPTDYNFFDEMFAEITENYCVDLDEVYAIGHSLGGYFTNSLACARGDVLRAVASLGGSRSASDCSGPVAVMQFHNPNDRLASFSSGVAARDGFLQQNMCMAETVSVSPAWGNCVEYQGCGDFTPVVWCPHTEDYDSRGRYYPHNWPKTTGQEMWLFFQGLES